MELFASVNQYEWGKKGSESMVAKLAKLNNANFIINENVTYSELWMGDHINGPSLIKSSNKSLSDFIKENRYVIGNGNTAAAEHDDKQNSSLPFLFKVLSIAKGLSIQVHPNKEEAKRLYAVRPDLYKDPNHKPELAIALTPFTALCGFRSSDEMYKLFNQLKPLVDLISKENIETLKTEGSIGIQKCFTSLMVSSNDEIIKCIKQLEDYFNKETEFPDHQLIKQFKILNSDFPNDIGILCLFFLNLIELKPGESIYLPANVAHAYLSGDCIECMACSDNTIRAGLTPKFKDVPTLLNMLNYTGGSKEQQLFQSYPDGKYKRIFSPPVKDFAVVEISILNPNVGEEYSVKGSRYGSIIIVLSGKAEFESLTLTRGSIIFIPANDGSDISLKIIEVNEKFLSYQAMFNEGL